MDDHGHGTHVAATAAGNGLLKGVAPDAKILAYKVCFDSGSCPNSYIISAINSATDPNGDADPSDHVDVANISLAGLGNPDDAMSLAVDNSTAAGVVYAIAAGNTGSFGIMSPGTARTAITVAAACKASQVGVDPNCSQPIANFSSKGPLIWNSVDLQKPDVAAPGVQICAARWDSSFPTAPTCFDSQHMRINGTSMASPHVAGAAALALQTYPAYTPAQIKQLLKDTAQNLGVSYDAQGAGEINVTAAIPPNSQITPTPNSWNLESDPSVNFSVANQTFSIAPLDPLINTLDISANFNASGTSINFDKTILNVAGQATDTFTTTLTVDNDVAAPGTYIGTLVFKENGVTKGVIPLSLTVKPTLILVTTDSLLDYGVDAPLLATWTSPTKQITLTNLRTDISQDFAVTASSYPSGISFQSASLFTVPPNSTANLDTSFIVDNSQVANGTYTGSVTLANDRNVFSFTTQFIKFYVLTLEGANGNELIGATIWVHDRTSQSFLLAADTNPETLYLNAPGPYDAEVIFPAIEDFEGSHQHTVLNEGLDLTGGLVNVPVSRAQAVHRVEMRATDPFGEPVSDYQSYDYSTIYLPHTSLNLTSFTSRAQSAINYYSDINPNYQHGDVYNSPGQPAVYVYYLYGGFTGLNADLVYLNNESSFASVNLPLNINKDTGDVRPVISHCFAPPLNGNCHGTYNTTLTLPLPLTQTLFTNFPAGSYFKQLSDQSRSGCPVSGACNSIFSSPYFDPRTLARKNFSVLGDLPPISGGAQHTGLGPSVWALKFNNTSSQVRLAPYYTLPYAAFLRQDFALQEYDAIPYTVTQSGNTVASGSLPAYSISSGFEIGAAFSNISLPASVSTVFSATLPYQITGQNFNATTTATFSPAVADPNPPAFKRLYYFNDATRSEVHDNAAAINKVEFELDAIGGSLNSPQVKYSTNGSNFTSLSVANDAGVYSASVPPLGAAKIILQIIASDNGGNQLDYAFELPVINPLLDTEPPTTSITSPSSGQAFAGIANIEVSASDNVGVTLVELYRNNVLFDSTATPPYNFVWDTTASPEGAYTLQSKAYDAAGNNASSTSLTVHVDRTLPFASITAPNNGATVSGNVTVSAAASDNTAVSKVEFYRDGGELLGTDTTSPYSMIWDSSQVSLGSHILYAKAYDTAGNTATSTGISVTVTDVTAPSVAITSPANNSTVPRGTTVTITAEASDNVGVTKVEFYVGNTLKCTDTAPAYSCAWSVPNAPNKTYKLTAKAYDAANNIATSPIITVTSQ